MTRFRFVSPLVVLLLGCIIAPPVGAQVAIHGIAFSKGCQSPVAIGAPYICTVAVQNTAVADTVLDTLTFTSIIDTVHTGAGDVTTGNLLPTLGIALLQGGASCNVSGTNTGPTATGNTLCTLPSGAGILFLPFTHHVVAASDPNPLTDTAILTWEDLCTSGANNCPLEPLISTSASQATIIVTPPPPPPPAVPTLSTTMLFVLVGGLIAGVMWRKRGPA